MRAGGQADCYGAVVLLIIQSYSLSSCCLRRSARSFSFLVGELVVST